MKNSMLEYKGYHASIEFDAEDNLFVGEVFGITDSLNFHGESVSELKEMFKQCIDNYLEICQQIGKQPDKEFKGTFNVRITPELHKRAALEAARQKITLNQYVSNAINKSFDKNENDTTTIIYIPNQTKEMNWVNKENSIMSTSYCEEPIWTKKERLLYAGN